MKDQKIHYVLSGFTEALGSRVFAFEGVSPGHDRSHYTVSADLALARRYGIRLQELPLLCRSVLDRLAEDDPSRALTYSEDEMCTHAAAAAARSLADHKRKNPRRPSPESLGHAWRNPSSEPHTRSDG